MQPGDERSAGSRAGPQNVQGEGKKRAFENAMNSRTASLLGIPPTRPASSKPAAASSSLPPAGASAPVMSENESEEEENSFDKNDAMSEEEMFVDGHIEIADDGHIDISDDDGVSGRAKKPKKGMKVGPKVTVQSSGKVTSKVWEHFEKVEVPSTTETGAILITARAQCNYCKKFFSYRPDRGGAISPSLRAGLRASSSRLVEPRAVFGRFARVQRRPISRWKC